MPKVSFCPTVREQAKKHKINISKLFYRIFENMGIEDENFTLEVVAHNFENSGTKGDCGVYDTENPRRFRIRLSEFETSFHFVWTAAHECKHLFQFLKKELIYSDCGKFVIWRGKKKELALYPYTVQGYEKDAEWFAKDMATFFVQNQKQFSLAAA